VFLLGSCLIPKRNQSKLHNAQATTTKRANQEMTFFLEVTVPVDRRLEPSIFTSELHDYPGGLGRYYFESVIGRRYFESRE
jgi:hypothetical protein